MITIQANNLEDALIQASSLLKCSIIDLDYQIIQHPSKGFWGLCKKQAIIKASIKTTSKATSPNTQPTDLNAIAKQVQEELKALFELLPYEISELFVTPLDEKTLYIRLDGNDAPLLIGKEGYRYKALSYLIFNWINQQYQLSIQLEIAEFLKNQEAMIAHYLIPIIANIKLYGKGQTKPLDGILASIALKQLRNEFPNKYVAFRINNEGKRYIIINDFHQ